MSVTAGHSAALWLVANPKVSVTIFDVWSHAYASAGEVFLRGDEGRAAGIVNGDARLSIVKGLSHRTVRPALYKTR